MEENNKFSLEEGFKKLDETIKEMEGDDVTLERSFQLYKEGIDLIKKCSDEIDTVEKQVLILSGNGEASEFQ